MALPQLSAFSWRSFTSSAPLPRSSRSFRSSKSSRSSQTSQATQTSETIPSSKATQTSHDSETPQVSTIPASPPVSPPARLFLRNILPSCPEGMPTPPPPPRKPYPWLWQCHSCSTVYRIGITRRCLVCSHEYCISSPPSTKRRGSKRRRPSGSCASEFDYSGWAEWGAWRRKVVGLEVKGTRQRERAFVAKTHNCVVDCDYPSECHHVRYRLQNEAREEKQRERLQTLPEEPRSPPPAPPVVATRPVNPDDELPLNEAIEVLEHVSEDGELKSPTSPLRTSFFFFDDPDEVDAPDGDEEELRSDNEGLKKRKAQSSETNQRTIDEQFEAGASTINTKDVDEKMLRRLIGEDEEVMPPDFLGGVLERCQSRMSSREHPKHGDKLTVRNLTGADEWESSSDGNSDSSSISPSGSEVESLSVSESTNLSEESAWLDGEESDDESDGEIDTLVAAEKSFLRD
ncbi:hypothetical protein GGR53DRAFT_509086 [Hypoxylon sp. FL1150]|nr:hypothetical protein GGR53DRAFT_509086 [Hypoxylon sp. FL1150]